MRWASQARPCCLSLNWTFEPECCACPRVKPTPCPWQQPSKLIEYCVGHWGDPGTRGIRMSFQLIMLFMNRRGFVVTLLQQRALGLTRMCLSPLGWCSGCIITPSCPHLPFSIHYRESCENWDRATWTCLLEDKMSRWGQLVFANFGHGSTNGSVRGGQNSNPNVVSIDSACRLNSLPMTGYNKIATD